MVSKKRSTPAPRRKAPQADAPVPQVATAEERHPIDTAVDTFFKNDDRTRAAMSRNLKGRGAATLAVAGRAKKAFGAFFPSKYSPAERAKRNFVPAGEDPASATRAVVDKGVAIIRASAPQRAMRVHLGGGLAKHIDKGRGGADAGTVALGDLMEYVSAKVGTTLTAPTGAAFTECRAEMEAEKRLQEILDGGAGDDEEAAPDTVPGADTTARTDAPDADELVSQQVQTQMSTATSPEERLRFAVPARSDPKQTDKAIGNFELRAGPADVTSYHDFNHLQIAFEHVWTEIFDGRLTKLGQELYHEYVKLQEFVGVAPGDRSIDTIDDLRSLMAEIRELGRLTNEVTPAQLQAPGDSTGSTTPANTTDTVVDVVTTILDPASVLTDAIGDETVAAILNPVGAIINAIGDLIKGIPQIRWASFSGPLPGNADIISVTVEANAVPAGTVEIVLVTGAKTRGWKGIKFTELDANKRPKNPFWIANDPNDWGVWNKNAYNRLPLYTGQAASAYLEFWHEGIAGFHAPCYVMDALSEKLTDRTRVTFTWSKD